MNIFFSFLIKALSAEMFPLTSGLGVSFKLGCIVFSISFKNIFLISLETFSCQMDYLEVLIYKCLLIFQLLFVTDFQFNSVIVREYALNYLNYIKFIMVVL